ncbi:MAG: hypothetical protein IPG07_08980 [Crocinitomicaceae bacterium]|nr:hypothetical protein [Crocinitomicaceae bacterium]
MARWAVIIEKRYKCPMDIEWAKDGITSQMYIVQARPETVHSNKTDALYSYELKEKGNELTSGIALGSKIATGKAKIIQDTKDASQLNEGDILITDITNPDWDPIMKSDCRNKGGRPHGWVLLQLLEQAMPPKQLKMVR